MGLDLRLPLGLMFSIIGVILLGYGLLTRGSGQYAISLGLNVNLGWGLVMLVFGSSMFLFGWRSRRLDRSASAPGGSAVPHRHTH